MPVTLWYLEPQYNEASVWGALGTPGTQITYRVSQVLQRRLPVLLTLCLPSFSTPLSCSHSDFWETPATGRFTPVFCGYIALSSSPAHFAVTLHLYSLSQNKLPSILLPSVHQDYSASAFPSPDDWAEWPKGCQHPPRQMCHMGEPALPNHWNVSYGTGLGLPARKPHLEKPQVICWCALNSSPFLCSELLITLTTVPLLVCHFISM